LSVYEKVAGAIAPIVGVGFQPVIGAGLPVHYVNTLYTNNGVRPLKVAFVGTTPYAGSGMIYMYVDNVLVDGGGVSWNVVSGCASCIVPPGSTYKVAFNAQGSWFISEL